MGNAVKYIDVNSAYCLKHYNNFVNNRAGGETYIQRVNADINPSAVEDFLEHGDDDILQILFAVFETKNLKDRLAVEKIIDLLQHINSQKCICPLLGYSFQSIKRFLLFFYQFSHIRTCNIVFVGLLRGDKDIYEEPHVYKEFLIHSDHDVDAVMKFIKEEANYHGE